jgi:hypothetical protein
MPWGDSRTPESRYPTTESMVRGAARRGSLRFRAKETRKLQKVMRRPWSVTPFDAEASGSWPKDTEGLAWDRPTPDLIVVDDRAPWRFSHTRGLGFARV